MRMTDYKQLYLKLFSASEDAIERLAAVQRECEEMIISDNDIPPERKITVLTREDKV